jgi:hypothetical protein
MNEISPNSTGWGGFGAAGLPAPDVLEIWSR